MRSIVRGVLALAGVIALVACTAPAVETSTDGVTAKRKAKKSTSATDPDSESPSEEEEETEGAPSKTKSKTTGSSGGTSSGGTSSGGTSSGGTSSGGTSSGGTGEVAEFAKCAALTSTTACGICCGGDEDGDEPVPQSVYDAWDTCACEADCASVCGTSDYCTEDDGPTPSSACEQCVAAKCDPAFDQKCAASATCAKYTKCYDAARCDDMEDE